MYPLKCSSAKLQHHHFYFLITTLFYKLMWVMHHGDAVVWAVSSQEKVWSLHVLPMHVLGLYRDFGFLHRLKTCIHWWLNCPQVWMMGVNGCLSRVSPTSWTMNTGVYHKLLYNPQCNGGMDVLNNLWGLCWATVFDHICKRCWDPKWQSFSRIY